MGKTERSKCAGAHESKLGRDRVSNAWEHMSQLRATSEFQWSYWDERSGSCRTAREAASKCGQRASFNRARLRRGRERHRWVTRTGELAGVSESSPKGERLHQIAK